MDQDDECSLHYKFSKAINESDQKSGTSLIKNILQRENPFNRGVT